MRGNWSLDGLQVAGQGLSALVEGPRSQADRVRRILESEGLLRPGPSGRPVIDPNGWYPLESWVRVFERLSESIGAKVLYQVGRDMAVSLRFPPLVKDVFGALRALNVAYQMNHRRRGLLLVNPMTGKANGAPDEPGVGSYACEKGPGSRCAKVRTETPYPCELDHGLVDGVVGRFTPRAFVQHDEAMACRKRGDPACCYLVHWA